MATDEALVFRGMRWSAAQIQGQYSLPSIESVTRGTRWDGREPTGDNPPGSTVRVKANPRANAEGKVITPLIYASGTRDRIPDDRWLTVAATPHIMRALQYGDLVQQAKAESKRTRRPGEPAPTPCKVFTISVTGGGRPWEASDPEAFWRTFADLDFIDGDGADVLRFVQRHGDPEGMLIQNRGGEVDTLRWIAPAARLSEVAKAWDPPDADGASYCTDDSQRLNRAREPLQAMLASVASAFDVVPDATGHDLAKRAGSLQAFMFASAASALRRGVPMRQCDHCADWFEARRRDMRFCSASCRAAKATAQRER